MVYTVLHCLARMNRGGAETLIMNIYRHIDRKKYNFFFLLNEEDCDYADEIIQLGGRIYKIPPRSTGIVAYCKALNKFFYNHKGEFDAVHMHTSSLSSLELLFFAKKYGVKKRIIHSHSTVQAGLVHNILHWFNKPWLRFGATDYLSCSQVASDWLYKYTGVWSKSTVINNGIDLKLFEFNEGYRKEIRKKYHIDDNAVVLGHVGRFDVGKNHTFLIDIYDNYQRIHPEAKLVCVGVGSMMDTVGEKVERMNLSEKVVFAGLQQEIYKYLSAFDYFIFPSLYEGLPVALVEAQASGVITVCSDVVSDEVCLSIYLTKYDLNKSAEEWAAYINSIKIDDRRRGVYQLEEKGYSIDKTVQCLIENIYL